MIINLFMTLLSIHSFISSTDASQDIDKLLNHFNSTDDLIEWEFLQDVGNRSKGDHFVVAQDGHGDYRTIQEAVNAAAARQYRGGRIIIHVNAGVYNETVRIRADMKNLTMVGDGIGKTIITGSRSVKDGYPLLETATFGVDGEGFMAQGITFQNSAGPYPENGQAIALLSASDKSVFYNCSFEGYQDTLHVKEHRQFYRECKIYGTIDFIFGYAAAVFQNCEIVVRRGLPQQQNCITAHGKFDQSPGDTWGISVQDSKVVPAPEFQPVVNQYKTYLGRPWKEYAKTVFMHSYLDGFIDPEGWLPWENKTHHLTAYYGEYENNGPGASTARRISWPDYHVMNYSEASQFTVENFIQGNSWLPSMKVPFKAGL